MASVILALGSAVGASTIGYDTTSIQIVAGIGVVLDSVWILLVSIFLRRGSDARRWITTWAGLGRAPSRRREPRASA